jgi:hypothetical protein
MLTKDLLAFCQFWLLRMSTGNGRHTKLYARLERAESYLLKRMVRDKQ